MTGRVAGGRKAVGAKQCAPFCSGAAWHEAALQRLSGALPRRATVQTEQRWLRQQPKAYVYLQQVKHPRQQSVRRWCNKLRALRIAWAVHARKSWLSTKDGYSVTRGFTL